MESVSDQSISDCLRSIWSDNGPTADSERGADDPEQACLPLMAGGIVDTSMSFTAKAALMSGRAGHLVGLLSSEKRGDVGCEDAFGGFLRCELCAAVAVEMRAVFEPEACPVAVVTCASDAANDLRGLVAFHASNICHWHTSVNSYSGQVAECRQVCRDGL